MKGSHVVMMIVGILEQILGILAEIAVKLKQFAVVPEDCTLVLEEIARSHKPLQEHFTGRR